MVPLDVRVSVGTVVFERLDHELVAQALRDLVLIEGFLYFVQTVHQILLLVNQKVKVLYLVVLKVVVHLLLPHHYQSYI